MPPRVAAHVLVDEEGVMSGRLQDQSLIEIESLRDFLIYRMTPPLALCPLLENATDMTAAMNMPPCLTLVVPRKGEATGYYEISVGGRALRVRLSANNRLLLTRVSGGEETELPTGEDGLLQLHATLTGALEVRSANPLARAAAQLQLGHSSPQFSCTIWQGQLIYSYEQELYGAAPPTREQAAELIHAGLEQLLPSLLDLMVPPHGRRATGPHRPYRSAAEPLGAHPP